MMRRALAFLAALILAPTLAWGQGAILQGGPWAAGHAPMYVGQGSAQPIVQDSGPAGGGGIGVGLSELGVTARGTGTAPYAGQGTGPLGTNVCDYDAPTTNAAGYHFLCLSANVGGNAVMAIGAGGAATPGSFVINLNGVNYPFPGTGVSGPGTSVANDAACWNNAIGTALFDCGPIRVATPNALTLYVNGDPANPQTCGQTGVLTCAPGNDTTGVGTTAAPFLTLNHACATVIAKYDSYGQRITIDLAHAAHGTAAALNYGGAVCAGSEPGAVSITIAGDDSAQTAVTIDAVNSGYGIEIRDYGSFTIRSLQVADQGSSLAGILYGQTGIVDIKGLTCAAFNASASCIVGNQPGTFNLGSPLSPATTSISIVGGAGSFASLSGGAQMAFGNISTPVTFQQVGISALNLAFPNGFINAKGPSSIVSVRNTTFTGAGVASVTGPRAILTGPAYLSGGANACNSIFPGSTPCQINPSQVTDNNDGWTTPLSPANGGNGVLGGQGPGNFQSCATGVNFNTVGDTAISVPLPSGVSSYIGNNIRIFNASASLTTAQFGLFQSAGGAGNQLIASGTAITVSTASANTNGNSMSVAVANANSTTWNYTTLQFRVTNPQGSAATADVCFGYIPAF